MIIHTMIQLWLMMFKLICWISRAESAIIYDVCVWTETSLDYLSLLYESLLGEL